MMEFEKRKSVPKDLQSLMKNGLLIGAKGTMIFKVRRVDKISLFGFGLYKREALGSFRVTGGPYNAFPGKKHMFGICVRAERASQLEKDIWLPIVDFDVPRDKFELRNALRDAVQAGIKGNRPIYVGCMGGMGRTGLFLALLAKACGSKTPVEDVRAQYYEHAVETPEQYDFVKAYDATELTQFAQSLLPAQPGWWGWVPKFMRN